MDEHKVRWVIILVISVTLILPYIYYMYAVETAKDTTDEDLASLVTFFQNLNFSSKTRLQIAHDMCIDSGLNIINADFIQYRGFSNAPVQCIIIQSVNDFITHAKAQQEIAVYFGTAWGSNIYGETFWFRLDSNTLVVLDD